MTEEKSELFSRLKAYVKFQLFIIIIMLPLYLLFKFVRPFWHAYWVRNWLTEERDYIQDYTANVNLIGYYRFEVELIGGLEPEIVVQNRALGAPVIVSAKREFDVGVLANVLDRRDVKDFKAQIEYILATTPGIHRYEDVEGNPVPFREADALYMEYRIYPKQISQHELINAIIDFAKALRFINNVEEEYLEELEENR